MGLHVSTLLSHLQALVYSICTRNALRIVGSPTLTITNKVQKHRLQYRLHAIYRSSTRGPEDDSVESKHVAPL